MFKPSKLLARTVVLLFLLAVANLACADPSGRVALVTDSQGSISFSPAGETEWVGVVRNRPLIMGDRLWSDQDSQAEFQIGSSAVRLGPNTSVEILDLNDNIAQLQVSQGSVNVSIRRLYRGQVVEIDTPMLAFSINRAGRYRIDVDPYDGQTTITVWKGAGTAYGEGASFRVKSGEAVAFYDVNLRDYEIYGLAEYDDFDRYAQVRDQRWEQSVSLQYVGDDLVGYADLDTYGSWGVAASYGNVWYPTRVSAGWAPYRDGHWVWQ
ncbi:MAG: FecR family protein, partial [Xanthomonadales bacterium]|nr:FecR family protein [Xanthomonadales bacterium]